MIALLIIIILIWKRKRNDDSKEQNSQEENNSVGTTQMNSLAETIPSIEYMNVLYNSNNDNNSDPFDCSESINKLPKTMKNEYVYDPNDVFEI